MQGPHVEGIPVKADSGIVTMKIYPIKHAELTSEGAITISFINKLDHRSNDGVWFSSDDIPTDMPGIPLSNKEEYVSKIDMSLKEESVS